MTHVAQLQKQYPVFRYISYLHTMDGDDLHMTWSFEIGEHKFFPKSILRSAGRARIQGLEKTVLDHLVFQLGLAEIASYWKLTCSPTIMIESGFLNEMQLAFWQKLIEKGMGEFFFVNDIVPFAPAIEIAAGTAREHSSVDLKVSKTERCLVPVGGGKDSIVTMELLTQAQMPLTLFTIGKDCASQESIEVYEKKYGTVPHIHVDRFLDPTLLELNTRGYLNGHTPFSSIVAFTSLLTASICNIPYIPLSNERSANEGTGIYQGVNINHQYSKTFEFESDFRRYVETCFTNTPSYFSLLRPLYEIQIMRRFTTYPEYFHAFRSCNIGKKKNEWCGDCAKCLFVTLLLSAFLPAKKVIEIFGKDMLSDVKLIPLLKQLTGDAQMKAFECVGTTEETMLALFLTYRSRILESPLPALLQEYKEYLVTHEKELETRVQTILTTFDNENLLPASFDKVLS